MSEVQEVLAEGPGNRVVRRIGDEVHRPRYPWSRSVHAVLHHLEAVGFEGAPRVIGGDDHDEAPERLTYLPGDAGRDGWAPAVSETGLASAAELLRRYHDAVTGLRLEAPDGWSSGPDHLGAVVLHGDPGPWNMVWRDGRAVALIDWDHANPGAPREDVAYLAAYGAPLVADDEEAVRSMRYPGPPDRRARLEVIAKAYGTPVDGLVDDAIAVMEKTNRTVERLGALGIEPQATWVAETTLEGLWRPCRWMVDHRADWI